MHMCVWQPTPANMKLINKYIKYNTRTWNWERVPMQGEMFPKPVKAEGVAFNAATQLTIRKSQPRDSRGRFISKQVKS